MMSEVNQLSVIYAQAQKASIDNFNSLNNSERRIVSNIFSSIINNKFFVPSIDDKEFESIKLKLSNNVKSESSLLQKICNLFAFIFGRRPSAQKLVNDLQSTKIILSKNDTRIKLIDDLCQKIEENTRDLKDLIRFKNEFASRKYNELADLYSQLSDQESAKEVLLSKGESIQQEINSLDQTDPDFTDKKSLLERELLVNIKKMALCSIEKWPLELKINQDVWKKVALATQNHKMEEEALEKNKVEMDKLTGEKSLLNEFAKTFNVLGDKV